VHNAREVTKIMSKSKDLTKAKGSKSNEFYTQISDIEKELKIYRKDLKGLTVFCNCDDPVYSNFWRYFHLNFDLLGLKKLIATHYEISCPSYKIVYEGGDDNDCSLGVTTALVENGDFRSDECVELLKESDIVVTNPPFSLFREYVAQLMKYEKKFIIIGSINSVTYKDFFPLIKTNKVWLGFSIHGGDREFRVPESYPLTASGIRVDADGNKYIRVKGVRWFTNIDYIDRHKDIDLLKNYVPNDYPKYDNYDAINIAKTADIPCDYDGFMGVPITFLDKFNPEQFEIIGLDRYVEDNPHYGSRFKINNKETYARIIIRRK